MKATVKQIVDCYRALGEAKVTRLEESEIVKIVKARKAMRQVVNDFEEFQKDVEEKAKPENFKETASAYEEIRMKASKEEGYAPDEEDTRILQIVNEYFSRRARMENEELSREAELSFELLSEDSATKILMENGWELKKLDEIDIIF